MLAIKCVVLENLYVGDISYIFFKKNYFGLLQVFPEIKKKNERDNKFVYVNLYVYKVYKIYSLFSGMALFKLC